MKVKCKEIETPPAFQPRELTILIDTGEEMEMLRHLFGLECTITNALVLHGALGDHQADPFRKMLHNIYRELVGKS